MARWRTERDPDGFWWVLSGTNTIAKVYGEKTAKLIVREHNEREKANSDAR